MEAAWRCREQSGRPLPPIEARPQATSGSDQAKSGEPLVFSGQNRRGRLKLSPGWSAQGAEAGEVEFAGVDGHAEDAVAA